MPIFSLTEKLIFPPPEMATREGLLAIGGDLRPERLLLAYSMGIFPWPVEDMPLLWHSPDPRMVLIPSELHVGRSLRQTLRKRPYRLTMDTAFREVVTACAQTPRPGQRGTWITDEMLEAYCTLHRLGFAHSVEAWLDPPADGSAPGEPQLVGGLYGVSLGAAYFGESMFAHADDASKVAFATFVRQLQVWGIQLVDCQVHTRHLERFGATQWPRRKFLKTLRRVLDARPTRQGRWRFDEGFDPFGTPPT